MYSDQCEIHTCLRWIGVVDLRAITLVIAGVAALLILVKTSASQTVTNIYNFSTNNASVVPLQVTPVQGRDGRLYGTTGGLNNSTSYGTVFKLSTDGAFKQMYAFDDVNGSQPNGGVTLASDGSFYGTAALGGTATLGVLFSISSGGALATLHEFAGGADGAAPTSPPIDGFDGNLYGTTFGNATTNSTVYKYTILSGAFTTIYQFSQAQGAGVLASLIRGTDGNLYGTAYQGGAEGCGTIFKMSTSGTLLWNYSFPCQQGGANPEAPLIEGLDGNFYGTTLYGGAFNLGTVFKLTQSGEVSILYSFQGYLNSGTDGSFPAGGLVQATDRNLYGTTQGGGGSVGNGTLFQISVSGSYKQLYAFTNTGKYPQAAPMQDTNGVLYGTTLEGGRSGDGAVYSLNMRLASFVALVSYTGKVGATAQILGQGLTGSTRVTFNGVPATSVSVVSSTYMTAVVPTGATTGPVVVTTPSGPLTSNKNFQITPGMASAARAKSGQPNSRVQKKAN